MERIITDLIEKLTAMTERALTAEFQVNCLKNHLESAEACLTDAEAEMFELKGEIEKLERELKGKDDTILWQLKERQRLEKRVAELETDIVDKACEVKDDGV